MEELFGRQLPRLVAGTPGPASRALARRLARVESRNITRLEGEPPIFWAAARGANVRDVDDNVYIDLTSGFGVATAGHAEPRVAAAVGRQAAMLAHAMGDVHPAEIKVRLLERLIAVAPSGLDVCILASAGTEAVEAALKTAVLHTGRPGIVAFTGGYHGLTYGSLAATWRTEFRAPFRPQLFGGIRFAPYPNPYRGVAPTAGAEAEAATGGSAGAGAGPGAATDSAMDPAGAVDASLAAVRAAIRDAAGTDAPIGAVLVEPVQGRGGIVVPPPGFLAGLRSICDEHGLLLIFDEVYTGFGRTGRWFASEHQGVRPDIMTVGKALTGMLPLSAAIGVRSVMDAWPPSAGEAIHTSTFLGNPIACAAALAQIDVIEGDGLVARAAALGDRVRHRLESWRDRFAAVGDVRGLGLMQGVELVEDRETKRPAARLAARVAGAAQRAGVLLLTEGPDANVLAIVPPLVITEPQLDHALGVIEASLAGAGVGV